MFTALIVTAVLSCKPYHPVPPPPPATTLACEGPDQVRRRSSDGVEIDRWSMAPRCTHTACEGTDFVRRDSWGAEVERWTNASVCPRPQPVRLTVDPKPVRFGLTSRG
jgi:hypothetical protein